MRPLFYIYISRLGQEEKGRVQRLDKIEGNEEHDYKRVDIARFKKELGVGSFSENYELILLIAGMDS